MEQRPMYQPAHFREDDPQALHALIRAHPFGLLVSQGEDGPFATHLPFHLEVGGDGRAVLYGHMARANPHWRLFGEDRSVLAVFQGPHGYVSPSWYAEKAGAVPTWNYAVVQARGCARVVEDGAEADRILSALTDAQEDHLPHPWRLADLEPEAHARLARGLVAFALPVDRLDGKFKLSQNRSAADRAGVTAALERRDDPAARDLARVMSADRPPNRPPTG